MKKRIALFLALILILMLSLAACGGDQAAEDGKTDAPAADGAQSGTPPTLEAMVAHFSRAPSVSA